MKVCSEAGRRFYLVFQSSPDLERLLRAVLCFSSSLFFSWLARSVRTKERWRGSACRRVSALRAHPPPPPSPMSPLSMARMSGLSLQSVWGTVPTISWRNSFSCMAKFVKLYICRQMRDTHTHTWTLFQWGQAPLEAPECMNQSHLCRVGGSGCDPPQQLTPRNWFNTVCSGRGNLLQVLRSRKTKIRDHSHATQVKRTLGNGWDWNQSHLSDLFLPRQFLVVFLMSFKGSGVYSIQALCPLPIQSTQLLFTATHTQILTTELSHDANRRWWWTDTH